jgi:hypothetical protein
VRVIVSSSWNGVLDDGFVRLKGNAVLGHCFFLIEREPIYCPKSFKNKKGYSTCEYFENRWNQVDSQGIGLDAAGIKKRSGVS